MKALERRGIVTRISVQTEALRSLGATFAEAVEALGQIGRRSAQQLAATEWESVALRGVWDRSQMAARLAADLAAEAHGLSDSLQVTAEAFERANAWRPQEGSQGAAFAGLAGHGSGAGSVASTAGAVSHASGGAGTPSPEGGGEARPGAARTASPVSSDVDAILAAHVPNPQERLILRHTILQEGSGTANEAHGAVVYKSKHGLTCDRQWLNFGLISFAMPSGSGGDVLRKILADPAEESAFKEIALRHLQDNPGGSVPASHQHLLRTGDAAIPPLTKEEQVTSFLGALYSGNDAKLGDWFFKYGNQPAVEAGVATGHLSPAWQSTMNEFLARPAALPAQIESAKAEYLSPALESASKFHLSSVKGVAWLFDQHVQNGGPNDEMLAMVAAQPPQNDDQLAAFYQAYQNGSEAERLGILTKLADAPDTTVYQRRMAVLANENLTWDSYHA
jgi:hypothetical protein